MFVLEADGEIAGFIAIVLDEQTGLGEIGLNAVRPDRQGAGLGGEMYAFALERMRKAGMRAATVGTGGDESHAAARRAYEKAGFSRAIPNVYYYKAL